MTIRSATGPWGSVRAEVRPDRGMFSVYVWINGQEQLPNLGLDRDDAIEFADEIVHERSLELEAQLERRVTRDDFPLDVHDPRLSSLIAFANSMHGWLKERRVCEIEMQLASTRMV